MQACTPTAASATSAAYRAHCDFAGFEGAASPRAAAAAAARFSALFLPMAMRRRARLRRAKRRATCRFRPRNLDHS